MSEGPEVLEKTPMNLVEVREELAKVRKRDTDLDIRGTKTEEYAKGCSSLSKKDAEELFQKIEKLQIPRFKEVYIQKIIDMLPANTNQLKTILQGYSVSVSTENTKKIVEIVADYRKK
jgi:DNA-directed RNA polymerase subunit F